MTPVYAALGLSTGFIQHDMPPERRQEAYAADVTYGTNNEFGFDYLRDNMVGQPRLKVQRGHHFAIVDEVDSILIDEARTPLIISGAAEDSTRLYHDANQKVARLKRDQDYEVDEKDRNVTLSEDGVHRVEEFFSIGNAYDPENMHIVHHVIQALRARELYQKDVDYVVAENEVVIVDEFTGRLMTGRRWSDGLHQAVEAKERLPIKRENQTMATITFQNYFKLYAKLSGMTGTADTEATEFMQIYNLDVVVLPTNQPMIRIDHPDVVFKTEKEKFNAVIEEIVECHDRGQPVLVGTISIEKSEQLAALLQKQGVPHQVLNAKQHEREAEIVAQAGRLKGVTIATNMAGRGTDIVLGGNIKALARLRTPRNQPELFADEFRKVTEECGAERDQVVALGGLHILGTERHEARRIDNQLRGRSGRQGDPGSSRFYISLEDELMRLFGSDRVARMMDVMKWEENEPIIHPWVTKAIARAQQRVEMMNFDRRKRLLDYDNVMNQQREVIYELRDMALEAEGAEIFQWLIDAATEEIDAVIAADAPPRVPISEWNTAHLVDYLRRQFSSRLTPDVLVGPGATPESMREMILSEIQGGLDERKQVFGEKEYIGISRQIILMQVDSKWKEHLSAMDGVREGIGWRGVGGSDPLVEYKHEAFRHFEELIGALHDEIVRFAFHVAPVNQPRRPAGRPAPGIDGKNDDAHRKKVGRNDPCPCGSGKKYKKCCGA